MKSTNKSAKGRFDELTRREFMIESAIGAAAMSLLGNAYTSKALTPQSQTRIGLIFAHPDPSKPNWPNIHYDFAGHIKKVQNRLTQAFAEIAFIPTVTSSGSKQEAEKILRSMQNVDGLVIYLAGCLWGELTETIAASGKPTVIVDHLFAGSGEFLTSAARAKRAGHKIIPIASSDFEDVIKAVRCLDTVAKLRHSKLLVVGRDADAKITAIYGTQVQKVEFEEINDAYRSIPASDAAAVAEEWIKKAEKVVEPSRAEITKSAAMYLAMDKLLKTHGAQAITINCLGGVYGGKMVDAYPCLGFMQLDDEGRVGGCEADQRSAMTKLLMRYLADRPGYISDPVVDTAKNRISYAHCVAPTKVWGPAGPSNPYHIRSHSEDRKGASIRSLLPLGKMTTTILFDHNKKQVILHQGKSVENVDEDMACRTKLAVEVKGDVFKLLDYWDQWGWHRVTFFGDLKRDVYNVAAVLGFEVVEEA